MADLSQAAVARDWGTSREYVRQCVAKGCPLSSFSDARDWRLAHTGKESKKGPPPSSDEQLAFEQAKKYSDDPKIIAELAELFKTLINSARASEAAWVLLDEAFIEKKASKISVYLNLHSKAVEARVKAERMVREELERRSVLIPLNDAKTSVRRVVEIVISRLSSMPQNIAPRCNPHNPEHAMDILQEECTAIIADAQKASIA